MTTINAAASGTFRIGGDLEVNRLGFGAMRITGSGIWGDPEDPREARRTVARVPELGINFIDTADSYGPFVSEELLAEVLSPYKRGLVIATKGGLTRHGPNIWPPLGRPEYLEENTAAATVKLSDEDFRALDAQGQEAWRAQQASRR